VNSGSVLVWYIHLKGSIPATAGDVCVSAPSEAWCALRGESPRPVRFSHPSVSSVAHVAETTCRFEFIPKGEPAACDSQHTSTGNKRCYQATEELNKACEAYTEKLVGPRIESGSGCRMAVHPES